MYVDEGKLCCIQRYPSCKTLRSKKKKNWKIESPPGKMVKSVFHWFDPEIPEKTQFRVRVTHVDDFGQIYVHLYQNRTILRYIRQVLLDTYGGSVVKNFQRPETGQECITKYRDGMWYRARVLGYGPFEDHDPTEGIVCVLYVDYGNTTIVKIEDIRSKLLCQEYPIQAIRVVLSNARPVRGWPPRTLDFMQKLLHYDQYGGMGHVFVKVTGSKYPLPIQATIQIPSKHIPVGGGGRGVCIDVGDLLVKKYRSLVTETFLPTPKMMDTWQNASHGVRFFPFGTYKELHPLPPQLNCINFNHNSIYLKWNSAATKLTVNFILEMQTNGKQWSQIYNGPLHTFKSNQLRENTEYWYRIAAISEAGQGPFSSAFSIKTSKTPKTFSKLPAKPDSSSLNVLPPALRKSMGSGLSQVLTPLLHCVNSNHNSIKLKWIDGNDSINVKFILQMENNRRQWCQIYNGPLHSFKSKKLDENTEYRYRIAAITDAGQASLSETLTIKTAFFHPPELRVAPRITGIQDSSCLVEWGALKPAVPSEQLRYQLELTKVKDGSKATVDAGANLHLWLECLEPKTEYTVRVAAVRTPCVAEPPVSLVGRLSPTCRVTTLLPTSSRMVEAHQPPSPLHSKGESFWTEKKLFIVILVGFSFFSLLVAFIVQQIISIQF